ncbi:MAG: hypothetical protein ACLGG0_05065 [Bacteriovoracia bacterium]
MKLLNQNGMSLKPVAVMLVILASLTYYILNDIKKIQTIPVNNKAKANEPSATNSPAPRPDSAKGGTVGLSHEEWLVQLAEELKKPGVCQSAFINREGKLAKFLNTEEIPPAEDIVKVMLKNEVVLEIDKEISGQKVQDIYFTSEHKTPIKNLGSSNVMEAGLQIVWQPINGGEPVLAKPIPLQLVVESTGQLIQDCYQNDTFAAAPVILPQPIAVAEKPPQEKPLTQTIVKEITVGSVCGVVNYECSGSFVGHTPYIATHPALQTDGTFCEGHVMTQPKCVFIDAFRGFRLEGQTCPDGYRALTHSGLLSDVESGSGSTVETKVLQLLMVLCVKQ